jgi:hypothetical protein
MQSPNCIRTGARRLRTAAKTLVRLETYLKSPRIIGGWPSGKAQGFDPCERRFESYSLSQ